MKRIRVGEGMSSIIASQPGLAGVRRLLSSWGVEICCSRCPSAYVTDGRKTPPLELTEALQIGCAMTRG